MSNPRTTRRIVMGLYSLGIVAAIAAGWYVLNHRSLYLPTSISVENSTDVSSSKINMPSTKAAPTLVGFEWVEVERTNERVTIYTFNSDKGGPHRTTASLNFLHGNARASEHGDYPNAATRLSSAHATGMRFCAIPWDWRWVHETIESWGKGQAWHSYVVEFPDRDPGQFYWPIDRVPKWRRTNKGYRVRQTAFDIFADMPDAQAKAIGDPVERVVIYKRTPVYSDEPGARVQHEGGWPDKPDKLSRTR